MFVTICFAGQALGQYPNGQYPQGSAVVHRPGAQVAGGVLQIIGGALSTDPRNQQASQTLLSIGGGMQGQPYYPPPSFPNNSNPSGNNPYPGNNFPGGKPSGYPDPYSQNQLEQDRFRRQQEQRQMQNQHEQNMSRMRAEQARLNAQNQQNMNNRQAQLDRDRKYHERQRTGAAVGTVAGGYIGGPAGASAGASVGGALGPDAIREGINTRKMVGKEASNARNAAGKAVSNGVRSIGIKF